jgi:hypothetical protein
MMPAAVWVVGAMLSIWAQNTPRLAGQPLTWSCATDAAAGIGPRRVPPNLDGLHLDRPWADIRARIGRRGHAWGAVREDQSPRDLSPSAIPRRTPGAGARTSLRLVR